MNHAYKRWTVCLLAGFAGLLVLCAGTVYAVDPYFHYHDPDPHAEVYFDERYQCAGLLRGQPYETLLLGTSLTANYRAFWFDVFYDTSTVKVSLPDGGFGEFDRALEYAFARQDVKRVIFGLDPNILIRDPAQAPDELPAYLYDDNPWNDGSYLLSRSVLERCAYVAGKKALGRTQPLQDAYVWDGTVFFSRELALAGYQRPPQSGSVLPRDAFFEPCDENLKVVTGWLERHPDTQFVFFLSPYSILFWDKMQRTGETDAMLAALSRTVDVLSAYDNAEVQCFLADREIIADLDNYADHIHVAGRVTYRLAQAMPGGTYLLTKENKTQILDGLREFVVHYDYDSIWAKTRS